jgi:CubicO group peptidase (beta-lactamase class C family)
LQRRAVRSGIGRAPATAIGHATAMTDDRAPPATWQIGPWNRWAYQHVGEVVATVAVPRDPDRARPLPERPLDLDAVESPPGLDGLAVLRDGALVHERYAQAMGPTTRHISQSVAKSVLGLLVGVLAGRGALSVDTPVTGVVPEVAGSGYAGTTVRHLLDMTAAVDFVEDYAEFWRYEVACGWAPPRPDAHARAILEYLPTIGPATDGRRHGERFHYASPNTDLLGIVAERAGGSPLAELLARELWGPLGAEADAELAVDPAGTAVISGGFCATLRDYARIGQLVLQDGAGIVPADWLPGLGVGPEAAFAGRVRSGADTGETGYGSKWWTVDGRVVARGIHGQLIAVDRDRGVVVAMLSSWPTATDATAEAAQRRVVDEVCDAVRARA